MKASGQTESLSPDPCYCEIVWQNYKVTGSVRMGGQASFLRILRMIAFASTIIYRLFQSTLSRFFRFGSSRILLLP